MKQSRLAEAAQWGDKSWRSIVILESVAKAAAGPIVPQVNPTDLPPLS
jgi:hypothetical protein